MRKRISELPDGNVSFDYSEWYRVRDKATGAYVPRQHVARTGIDQYPEGDYLITACVGGMVEVIWGRTSGYLDLEIEERNFLFFEHQMVANQDDALRRLDWLISEKPVDEYDWTQESWYDPQVHGEVQLNG